MFGLARAQAAVGGQPQAPETLHNLRRSFDYYVEVGDVDRAVAVAEFPFYVSIGIVTNHAELVSRALLLVDPDSHQAGKLLSTYGLTLYRETGNYEVAEDALTRALAIAQREQDVALELRTLAGAAELAWWSLRLPETVEYGRRAVELSYLVDPPSPRDSLASK